MHEPKTIIHGNTPRAARTLLGEIAKLRDDIHQQSAAIADMELALVALGQELRQQNIAHRFSRYLPADSE